MTPSYSPRCSFMACSTQPARFVGVPRWSAGGSQITTYPTRSKYSTSRSATKVAQRVKDRGAVHAGRGLSVGHKQSLATTSYLGQAGARNVVEGGRREAGEEAACGTYSRSYRLGAWRGRWGPGRRHGEH